MCFSCTAFAALHFYFLIHADLILTVSLIWSKFASVNVSHRNAGISSTTTHLRNHPLLGEKNCEKLWTHGRVSHTNAAAYVQSWAMTTLNPEKYSFSLEPQRDFE